MTASPTTLEIKSHTSSVPSMSMDVEPKLERTETEYPRTNIGCFERVRRIFVPIHVSKTVYKDEDGETHIIISPESLLILFYLYFWTFLALAFFITITYSDIDYEDNPIINTYGRNNLCLYFDYKPFNYIGVTGFIPCMLIILSYEILDNFRVYDSFVDKNISRKFYVFYRYCTIFEIISFIFVCQVFATTPFESIYMHSIPYFMFILALWSLAFKRFLYLNKTNYFKNYYKFSWLYYLGVIYVIVLLINVMVIISIGLPDLFGARIHKNKNFQWTADLLDINGEIHLVTCNVIPVFTNFLIAKDMDVIKLTVNRKRVRKQ